MTATKASRYRSSLKTRHIRGKCAPEKYAGAFTRNFTMKPINDDDALAKFNFGREAELFSVYNRKSGKRPVKYRRFIRAAEAVRFAVEELSEEFFSGIQLEVDERRYNSSDVRRLYESPRYPMARRSA
jgi:hypothetical protein